MYINDASAQPLPVLPDSTTTEFNTDEYCISYCETNKTWEGVERKPALAFWLGRGRVKLHLIHMAWLKHEAPQHKQLLSGHNFPIIKWTFLG